MFVGWWVPRVVATVRARRWLKTTTPNTIETSTPARGPGPVTHGLDKFLAAASEHMMCPEHGVCWLRRMIEPRKLQLPYEATNWPEGLLFVVLFVGLTLVVTQAAPDSVNPVRLVRREPTTPVVQVHPTGVVTPVANLLGLWLIQRDELFARGVTGVFTQATKTATQLRAGLPGEVPVRPRLKTTAQEAPKG